MGLAEIPSGAPCQIDEASCSHSQVAMWHRTAGTEGGGSHASSSSLSICDMLCGVSSRIVDNVSEEMRTEDLLRMHHRIPHTIVLDSHQPELAPHIVITPPDDTVIETWHAVNSNRPNPLDSSNLMPLPFYGLGLYPPPATLLHPSANTSDEPQSYNRITGVPLVFSHRVFRLSIIMSTEERLSPFTRNLAFSLYRHLFKSIAIIASERAENFRSRYDSPSFCETIERPFEWTDPAEAVISMYNRNFSNGRIILHSVEPFTIPHIIIHEAPPNDPWVIFANGTNVQDCSFGNSLVAPSSRFRPLRYANLPGYAIDQYYVDSCREDDDYFDDDASSTDSVCPSTPTGPSMELDVFEAQSPAIANAADDDETAFDTSNVLWDVDRNRVKHLFFIDEDEDDGPPEWDDWFEAAASRARDVETSNS
ncbi:hypothetical protein CPC08DRAFT_176775 [Agrocybe pediades]|nr:hypothetical protein CPC08DRAFT_176775 [Agrocybe pediades]